MKLQNLTVIFIIIMLPIILLVSLYINTGLRTIRYQALYDTGLLTATQDAIQAFEMNTLKNKYSDNAEMKRSIIKASINMFETSLCDTCNISSYNKDDIEEYIPAIVFGLNDGFYMYAPSYNPNSGKYEHSLKNYVYYSEMLDEENAVVIRYYLDSYVQVSGYFNGTYESQEGYLINTKETYFNSESTVSAAKELDNNYQKALNDGTIPSGTITYYGTNIDIADELAVNYFIDNYIFSDWFNKNVLTEEIKSKYSYLEITGNNDPEDPNSDFVQNKNKVIKEKIEGVLNSSITAYSERTWGQDYKMPKLSEEDWQKIYSDVSVTTFFQGKKIGLTKYNGYCVLNSNNHYELINPNLLYFSTDDNVEGPNGLINEVVDYYHDIRCNEIKGVSEGYEIKQETVDDNRAPITTIRGYKIGRFQKKLVEDKNSGEERYIYERNECACYNCINGSIDNGISLYDYINVATSDWNKEGHATEFITRSYWTSLARERGKLHDDKKIPSDFTIEKFVQNPSTKEFIKDSSITVINGSEVIYKLVVINKANKTEYVTITDKVKDSGDTIEIQNVKVNGADLNSEAIEKFKVSGYETTLSNYGELEIIYKAKIIDGTDADNSVTNIATVRNDYDISVEDSETCNTIASNLNIIKYAKKGDKLIAHSTELPDEKVAVEYGKDIVKYTVEIRNDASITDKIDITDFFNKNEIPDVFYKSHITISGDGFKDGNELSNEDVEIKVDGDSRIINIFNVDIGPGKTIKIEFESVLKGNIGTDIVNTAIVKSVYTGTGGEAKADVSCKIERKVDIHKIAIEDKKDILLILDTSLSMAGDLEQLQEAANDFMSNVVTKEIGTVTKVIQFGMIAKEKEIKDNKVSLEWYDVTLGTRYDLAWDMAYELIIEEREVNPDVIIFFSDGYSTWADGLIPVYPTDINEGYWNNGVFGDIGIFTQLNKIAEGGTSIFSVGLDTFGDFNKTLGVIPRGEGTAEQEDSIENIFSAILPALSTNIEVGDSYETYKGEIEVKYVNRIDRIEIDGSSKDDSGEEYKEYITITDSSDPSNLKGKLNLTGISGEKEVVIYYK